MQLENIESYFSLWNNSIALSISLVSLNGEVTCGAITKSIFLSRSIKFIAWIHADSELDVSPEISSERFIIFAPNLSEISSIFSLSELTHRSEIKFEDKHCSIVQAISGFPQKSIIFLLGISLEPPRAIIIHWIFLIYNSIINMHFIM